LPVTGYKRLGNYKLTAFEEIYLVSTDANGNVVETLVAEHKDVNDKEQTVKIPPTPSTGETPIIFLYGMAFILTIMLVIVLRKRFHIKKH
jgi:hypothetical protein